MTKPTRFVEVSEAALEAMRQRVKAKSLDPEDYEMILAVVESYAYLSQMVGDKKITIRRLQQLLFGPRTENTDKVLGKGGQPPAAGSPVSPGGGIGGGGAAGGTGNSGGQEGAGGTAAGAPKPPGHGRNGASEYTGAGKILVPHETLKDGDACPSCKEGIVYLQADAPAVIVRIRGQAPLAATVYEKDRLRCHLCGEVFTAASPAGVGEEKYDASARSMIALLKYGSGMPFHRLAGLQESLGIPLPAATQWEVVAPLAAQLRPVYLEMVRQAARGKVLHNDDTNMRILALMGKEDGSRAAPAPGEPDRKGVFTTGIVSLLEGRKIALFFTGHRHAGENLTELLKQRPTGLDPPIQMCDALSRNAPKEFAVLLANCLAHARRQFVDVAEDFPAECRFVLETLRDVYYHDALAREQNLSPEERLKLHQEKSKPLMEKLHEWLKAQFPEKRVEPNSSLGKAISYLLNHWKALSLFLTVPGAPLDNNVVERSLKRAILHRKNSYFYKTRNGAAVGDLFMSLIHTCRLCDANPFDFLTELQNHSSDLEKNPAAWMPWNYRETISADSDRR